MFTFSFNVQPHNRIAFAWFVDSYLSKMRDWNLVSVAEDEAYEVSWDEGSAEPVFSTSGAEWWELIPSHNDTVGEILDTVRKVACIFGCSSVNLDGRDLPELIEPPANWYYDVQSLEDCVEVCWYVFGVNIFVGATCAVPLSSDPIGTRAERVYEHETFTEHHGAVFISDTWLEFPYRPTTPDMVWDEATGSWLIN